MDLNYYFSLFLRRSHWFILVLLVCTVIGIGLARMLPTVYGAEARLVVESEQIPDELAASTVQTQATEQLQIIQQRILTRNILVEMANRLSIYGDRQANGEPPLDAADIVEDLRRRIKIEISGSSPAQRRGDPQATIVTVSFEAPTAQLAAAVTNEVVTLILREDVSMRTRVARQTLEFFEQDVEKLDRELSRKSAQIQTFKERNISSLPDSLDFRRSQQAAAQERLTQFERQEALLRDRRDRMIQLQGSADTSVELPSSTARSPEQQQLQQLKDERISLLAVLSPENPKVRVLEQRIAALEKIVAEQLVGTAVNESGQPMTAFDIQMADLEGQISYLVQQKEDARAEIEQLTASIAETPGNAIALATLEREYDAVQDQYNRAVANKARAETGDMIEALSKGQRISVIEQAIAPSAPTSPNRPVIAAAGIGGGMLAGLGLIALIELLTVGIRRPVDLVNGLGITPFATLPYLRSEDDIRRRRLIIWGSVVVALLGFALALWAIHSYLIPLDLLAERIRRAFG
ncbi:MAG: GumC family protein [Pseudorhodobacter sp.]